MAQAPWFPRNTPATTAAQQAAAQQAALDAINQSTDATEQILLTPSPLPVGGATEATQQLNQQALGTEGGGVTVPPPGGGTGILGWIRSIREFFQSTMTIVGTKPAIDVNVVQTVGGGGGGGDASAANQVTEIARLTSILAKIIAAPSTEAKQDSMITAINAVTAALGIPLTITMPTGASTEAKQDAIITVLGNLATILSATLTVGGTVAVSNFPVTQPVSGTFWQATQPVSGTFWQATQPVSLAAAPLPTGAATEASLLALIALLPSALSALSNFKVAVAESLPTGTNAIGKLAANSGVDIGDVDVTSLPATPAGTNIIGKVGIDQSTPGGTNNVEVGKLPKASSANTPSIVVAGGDVFASNTARKAWGIQNLGTNPLFVRMATGASSTVFHFCLAPGSANDDGRGASVMDDTYTGIVSATGTSPRFTAFEL